MFFYSSFPLKRLCKVLIAKKKLHECINVCQTNVVCSSFWWRKKARKRDRFTEPEGRKRRSWSQFTAKSHRQAPAKINWRNAFVSSGVRAEKSRTTLCLVLIERSAWKPSSYEVKTKFACSRRSDSREFKKRGRQRQLSRRSFKNITSRFCNSFVIIPICLTWKMLANSPGTNLLWTT